MLTSSTNYLNHKLFLWSVKAVQLATSLLSLFGKEAVRILCAVVWPFIAWPVNYYQIGKVGDGSTSTPMIGIHTTRITVRPRALRSRRRSSQHLQHLRCCQVGPDNNCRRARRRNVMPTLKRFFALQEIAHRVQAVLEFTAADALRDSGGFPSPSVITSDAYKDAPEPVRKYLEYALGEEQPNIKCVGASFGQTWLWPALATAL